ncbi:unnamed protein product [Pylaiella littoralis]
MIVTHAQTHGRTDGRTPATLGYLKDLASLEGRLEDVYELGEELGKGAFSVVKRGTHRQTGAHVALKLIPSPKLKGNKRAQEAIRAEIEAMRRIRTHINNPALIVMLGVFSDPTKVSIVLEELKGGELFDRIVARGRYTELDAAHLICSLVEALGQCHEAGIVHRDVKPENIMYTSRKDDAGIKLTDFGLALLYPVTSVTGGGGLLGGQQRNQVWVDNLVGTPGYVAPEVLSSRMYGPPCDVWACGVILYNLLAGYPPFFRTADKTLFEVIKEGRYFFHTDAWDQISREAKDLVSRMLVVDVEKRATIPEILDHPWLSESCDVEYSHLVRTIRRLKEHNTKRKWRAAAAVMMLGTKLGRKKRSRGTSADSSDEEHGFSALELETLKTAFLSSSEGGILSRAQLASVLSDIGFGPVPSDRMFDLFDKDGNGMVDFSEFLGAMSSFRHSGDKRLQFCFDIYDTEGVGFINLDQLKSVLSCVTRPQGVRAGSGDEQENKAHQDDYLTELFKRLDLDGNGTIDFEEFKAGAEREPLLVEAFLAPVQQGSLARAPAAVRKSKPVGATGANNSSSSSSSSRAFPCSSYLVQGKPGSRAFPYSPYIVQGKPGAGSGPPEAAQKSPEPVVESGGGTTATKHADERGPGWPCTSKTVSPGGAAGDAPPVATV